MSTPYICLCSQVIEWQTLSIPILDLDALEFSSTFLSRAVVATMHALFNSGVLCLVNRWQVALVHLLEKLDLQALCLQAFWAFVSEVSVVKGRSSVSFSWSVIHLTRSVSRQIDRSLVLLDPPSYVVQSFVHAILVALHAITMLALLTECEIVRIEIDASISLQVYQVVILNRFKLSFHFLWLTCTEETTTWNLAQILSLVLFIRRVIWAFRCHILRISTHHAHGSRRRCIATFPSFR